LSISPYSSRSIQCEIPLPSKRPLEITSDDETRQVVRFREPLGLPVPERV
jgi:hypothetical protein